MLLRYSRARRPHRRYPRLRWLAVLSRHRNSESLWQCYRSPRRLNRTRSRTRPRRRRSHRWRWRNSRSNRRSRWRRHRRLLRSPRSRSRPHRCRRWTAQPWRRGLSRWCYCLTQRQPGRWRCSLRPTRSPDRWSHRCRRSDRRWRYCRSPPPSRRRPHTGRGRVTVRRPQRPRPWTPAASLSPRRPTRPRPGACGPGPEHGGPGAGWRGCADASPR
jgi:hypothetical protein